MSKKVLLIELPYLPPVSWFVLAKEYETILLDQHAHFVKGTYSNRCKVLGPNGVLTLSVPLKHTKQQHKPMREIQISYAEPWQKIHWMTLCSCYRRSPYFEYFEDLFAPVYEKKWKTIIELNHHLLQLILQFIPLPGKLEFTETFIPSDTEIIDDKRNFLRPRNANTDLSQKVENYIQVFSDRFEFQEDLSIFDLLCNKGKYQL